MSGIYVVLEDRKGRFGRISLEAIAAANILAAQSGTKPTAIVIGAQTEALATEAANKNVGKVVRIEHALLTPYTSDGFTAALQQFIAAESPDTIVFPHTYQVRDYAPALAARLGRVLIGDVTQIADGPVFIRSLMQGRLSGSYKSAGSPTPSSRTSSTSSPPRVDNASPMTPARPSGNAYLRELETSSLMMRPRGMAQLISSSTGWMSSSRRTWPDTLA